MTNTWLKIEEVCERLGLSRHQVYRRIQAGQLPATLERGEKLRYLVSEDDIRTYLEKGTSRQVGAGGFHGSMLRVPDVASVLGFTAETVRRMCERGDLKHVRGSGTRGHYRIPRDAVNEYLARAGQPLI